MTDLDGQEREARGPAGDFVIADSEAQERGAIRMFNARGSVRIAFESLELGWTYDDVERYLLASPSYQAMLEKIGGDQHGLLQGLIMGFALVAVEQDRGSGG
jgi:hypothetical protein